MELKNTIDKIDIVIPWVDPLDKIWQEDKERFSPMCNQYKSNDEKFFRDWNTLKYLFRSIEVNMSWINNIHFLTYGHIPKWINTEHPKLKIQIHSSFFKKDHAFPVFSSDAIEMNLSNIPELTNKFIYFNDDEIVVKPVDQSRFFQNGLPVDCLLQDLPRGGWLYRLLRTKDVYPDICKNCLAPLNSLLSKSELNKKDKNYFFSPSYYYKDRIKNRFFNLYKNYLWIKPNHTPQPLLKSTILKCEQLFPQIIRDTANSRFRSKNDICHYLFRNYNLIMGEFKPFNYKDSHCIVLSDYIHSIKEIDNIDNYTFVCINDSEFLSHKDYLIIKPLLEKKLKHLFPTKSSFEK